MSDLRTTLSAALKEAMLAKDNARRDVIRGLQSAVKQIEIDARKDLPKDAPDKVLNDAEIMDVLLKEAKKRREAIEEGNKAGRADLAEKEAAELAQIETFLPRQLTLDEVKAIAAEIIAETGVTSAKDQNKVMGPLMAKVKGKADGKLVNQAVRELLNA